MKYEKNHKTKLTNTSSQVQSLLRLVPHMVTLAGLILGLSAIRYALMGKFDKSVELILIASVLDLFDGMIARAMGLSGVFGMALDSLCDMVSFGVCSPMVLYLWGTKNVPMLGWGVLLFSSVSVAIRLAKFQYSSTDESSKDLEILKKNFFQGLPAPAGATLNLIPICIWSEFGIQNNLLVYLAIFGSFVIGLLNTSKIPTFSLKGLKVDKKNFFWVMCATNVILISLVLETMMAVLILSAIYICSIAFSVKKYNQIQCSSETDKFLADIPDES